MKRSIWELAEEAQAEVEKWPEWKRRAADTALVSPRPWRPRRTNPMTEPDQSWGLHLDEPMAAFISHLAEELELRCQAVRSLYDNGSIDGPMLESLLDHLQEKSSLLWREHCRRKR